MRRPHRAWGFVGAVALASGVLALGVPGASPSSRAWADDPAPERGNLVEIAFSADTSIEDVLVAVGHKLGARLAWDPSLKVLKDKRLAAAAPLRVRPDRLLSAVRRLLAPYELVLVPMGPEAELTYWVMDIRQQSIIAKLKPVLIELTPDNVAAFEGEDGLFVTTFLRVQAIEDLRDVRAVLTKVSTQVVGSVTEVPAAHGYVVTDFAPAACAIYRTLRLLDVAPAHAASGAPVHAPDAVQSRLVGLHHARAEAIARVLSAHFGPPPAPPALTPPGPTAPPPAAAGGPRITPDPRTNQLLVSGSAAEIQAVLALLEGLDVAVEGTAPQGVAPAQVQVLALRTARADDLVRTLQALVNTPVPVWMSPDGSRPTFVAHGPTNVLVVSAAEKVMPAIRALVESLDPPPQPPMGK